MGRSGTGTATKIWLARVLPLAVAVALVAAAGPERRRMLLRLAASEYYYRSGWRALHGDRPRRAHSLFTRAQAQAVRPGEMSARIGLAYSDHGLVRPAARWLARAIQISPEQPAAVYLALGFKGTVLRTWGSESLEPRDQTYAGAEFEFSVAKVNFGVGALNRVDGDAGRPWIVTAHLGWGF